SETLASVMPNPVKKLCARKPRPAAARTAPIGGWISRPVIGPATPVARYGSAHLGIARTADSGVLPQPAGVLLPTERFQVVGKGAGGGDRVRVVRAEPAAVELVGVLEQGTGRPRLSTRPQVRPRRAEQPAHVEDDVVEPAGGVGHGQDVR